MNTNCKISGCSWTGYISGLFKHCETEHRQFVVDICNDTHFNLNMDEIGTNTYLLCGTEGLYWFCVNEKHQQKDRIERGIFAIADSQICIYRVVVGSTRRGIVAAQGPFATLPVDTKQFNVVWNSRQLMSYHKLKLNMLRIEFLKPGESLEFEKPNDRLLAASLSAIYPCKICGKDVDAEGSICLNRHCLCASCLGDSEQWFGTTECSICAAENQAKNQSSDEKDDCISKVMKKAVRLRAAVNIKNMLYLRRDAKQEAAKLALKAERKKQKKKAQKVGYECEPHKDFKIEIST